ncbi:hypothetical protein C7S13_4654 [Burkholderia cepacia]|nr:hypothetical protein [Burkholderia cepacia]
MYAGLTSSHRCIKRAAHGNYTDAISECAWLAHSAYGSHDRPRKQDEK